jgi:hypothetical protein
VSVCAERVVERPEPRYPTHEERASGSEPDVPDDPNVAESRRTGGRDPENEPDEHSATGTSHSETYVGRVTGEDAGDAGETGAEKRAESDGGGDTETD